MMPLMVMLVVMMMVMMMIFDLQNPNGNRQHTNKSCFYAREL